MNSTLAMPMPMRTAGAVAPYARVRVPWQASFAPVSAGLGLVLGSSLVCMTKQGHQDNATEINTKAHGNRRSQETST